MKAIGTVYYKAEIIPYGYWKKEQIGLEVFYYLMDGTLIVQTLPKEYLHLYRQPIKGKRNENTLSYTRQSR